MGVVSVVGNGSKLNWKVDRIVITVWESSQN